jgi:hypothetical protein
MARRRRAAALVVTAMMALAPVLAASEPATPAGKGAIAASGSASSSARTLASAPASARFNVGFAPDPPPLVTQSKWIYDVIYHEGAIFVPTPQKLERPRPTETPRRMGRFAIELYVGKALIERVRFDLPMLGGDLWTGEKKRPFNAPPDFERHARVRASVEVPHSERATFAVIVDRATGRRLPIPWPPVDGTSTSPASSSGAPVAPSASAPPGAPSPPGSGSAARPS